MTGDSTPIDPIADPQKPDRGRVRRDHELTSLHGLLRRQGGTMGHLLVRAEQIDTLNRALRGWTSEPWLDGIRVANASIDGALILFADNAAVLTSLRYKRDALLLHLRERHGLSFSRIEAKIRPKPISVRV